jgi:tripartite-type tricarboxylate transporter receptor subunit TctC
MIGRPSTEEIRRADSLLEMITDGAARVRAMIAAAAALVALLVAMPAADAQEAPQDFYRNKTLKIIVGFPPGGGFDLYARMLADYLPRYLPGEPKMIVESMPGASTARAASYLYNVAPQDGTVLGLFHHALLANQALEAQAGDFDVTKFNWIGRMATRLNVGLTWHTAGVRTIEDAKKREVVMAATAVTATSAMVPRAINHAAGTKFKVVLGYQGSADMILAMERGEAHGMSTGAWYDLARDRPDWIKDPKIHVLFQISTKRIPDLSHIPVLADLATTEDDRAILDLLGRTEDMGRAFPVGPRVPPERVALLRSAFAKMMADPSFLREAAKHHFEIDFIRGDELQKFIAAVGGFRPELRDKAKKILMR